MKKFFSLILAIATVFSITTSAYAAETESEYVDVLTYSTARSLNPPTQFYDLSKGPYGAHILELGSKWLYTNRCFLPGDNGRIYVDFNMKSAPNYTFYVGVYDMKTQWVYQQKTFKMTNDGYLEDDWSFSGLSSTGPGYAIAFKVEGDGTWPFAEISGTATISAS